MAINKTIRKDILGHTINLGEIAVVYCEKSKQIVLYEPKVFDAKVTVIPMMDAAEFKHYLQEHGFSGRQRVFVFDGYNYGDKLDLIPGPYSDVGYGISISEIVKLAKGNKLYYEVQLEKIAIRYLTVGEELPYPYGHGDRLKPRELDSASNEKENKQTLEEGKNTPYTVYSMGKIELKEDAILNIHSNKVEKLDNDKVVSKSSKTTVSDQEQEMLH